MKQAHQFVVLDALRGVAALIVVVYHVWQMFGGHAFAHGYLAVDFFFMLSGFVLTHTYQTRLDDGWALAMFTRTRIVRLYPLYFASLILSLILFAVRVLCSSPQAQQPRTYIALFLMGTLFIPSPVTVAGYFPMIFPLNPPAWSLFYEMLVNIGHAALGRRRSNRFLIGLVCSSALLLVAMTLHFRSLDAGETPGQFGYALVRVLFAYALGSLLCRAWKSGRVRVPNCPIATAVLLIAVFATPASWPRALVDLASVLVIFPLILLLGAAARPAAWMVRPSLSLGTASYGIYVMHIPVAALTAQIWSHVSGHRMQTDAPWSGFALLACTFAFVLLLDRIYDVPGRRWLSRRLHLTQPRGSAPNTPLPLPTGRDRPYGVAFTLGMIRDSSHLFTHLRFRGRSAVPGNRGPAVR